ncbi:MAG: methyltransferase [Steroidobacteraceae bacterium]
MSSAPPPISVLYQIGTGHYLSQALLLAAKLDVAELLKNGPRQADELAELCSVHAPALKRVLRLLASVGVFLENEDGSFGLTPVGELMHTAPGRAFVQLFAGDFVQRLWSDLPYVVQTGNTASEKMGISSFEYLASHPDEGANFDLAMSAGTSVAAVAVAAAYDFSPFHKVVDVGGGRGALLEGILNAYPDLHGILFDLPRVVEAVRERNSKRYEIVGGDFFESVPPGGDGYILKHVIHDWNDERAAAILKIVHRVMPPHGKLLIVEGVYPRRIDQSPQSRGAASNDVNMMVATGGRQRSEQEFRTLFAASGFLLARIIPTQGPSVIEGVQV